MGKAKKVYTYARKAYTSKAGTWVRKKAGPKIKDYAARKVQGAWTKYRSRRGLSTSPYSAIQSTGENPGVGTTKRFNIVKDTNLVGSDSATLYADLLTTVTKRNGLNEEINRRDGDTIFIKGININFMARLALTNDIAHTLNVAMIVPKSGATTLTAIPTDGFLRGDGTARSVNFTPSLPGFDLVHRAINTDIYEIIFRKRFKLLTNAGEQKRADKNKMVLKKYVAINRQFSFSADGYTTGQDPWMVYWLDDELRPAGSSPTPTAFQVYRDYLVYFTDSNCCP